MSTHATADMFTYSTVGINRNFIPNLVTLSIVVVTD